MSVKKVMQWAIFMIYILRLGWFGPFTVAIYEFLCLKNAATQIRYQCFLHQVNNRQPWQLKKSKSWKPLWTYQLDSSANPAHLPQKWAKWAELAALFGWYTSQTAPKLTPGFHFFSIAMGCQTFILADIHWYLSAQKSWHNNSYLRGVLLVHEFLGQFVTILGRI